MVQLTRIIKMSSEIADNLKIVQEKILKACSKRSPELAEIKPRLVAVSKIKPANLVIAAYDAGQKYFGENYVNELIEKSNHPDILKKDINWHFIGHLQKNKINKLLSVPNLFMIETIDNDKLATAIDSSWKKYRKQDDHKINVMVQVNTSNEKEKNGCKIEETSNLVKHILENCKNLKFVGLMTIGAYGYDPSNGINPDFLTLKKCRENVSSQLNIDINNIELSMGMSTDYEHAIELGSTNVRVGSAIFGERPPKSL